MRVLGNSGLKVAELCLGANVFGWTADEDAAFAVLDAYLAAGGNFIDTADSYSQWATGNSGGESEAMIGRWLASRQVRDQVVLATKVGKLRGRTGLKAHNVSGAVEESLKRLGTDHVDLYYAHVDDPETPLEETVAAFDALVRAGKVRTVGASNYGPERLIAALQISRREGLAPFVALQSEYNLVERHAYESALAPVVEHEGLASIPYYGLAHGFLTGKYRPGAKPGDSPRAAAARRYLDARGQAVLAALDEVSLRHGVAPGAVALSWLCSRPNVVAPIASARSTAQLAELLPVLDLRLEPTDLTRLEEAATP